LGSRDKKKRAERTERNGLLCGQAVGCGDSLKNKNYYFLTGLKKQTAGGGRLVGTDSFAVATESAKKNTHFLFSPCCPYVLRQRGSAFPL